MAKKGKAKTLKRLQKIHSVLWGDDNKGALALLGKWIRKEARLLECDYCREVCVEPEDVNVWVWSERPGEEHEIMRPLHAKCAFRPRNRVS